MSYPLALPDDVKKELSVDSNGKTSCSFRGLGRMFTVSPSRISSHFTDHLKPSKLAEMLMEKGFEGDHLASWAEVGVPDVAIPIIARYYAYESVQVGEETKTAARNFIDFTSAVSVRTFFQQQLGYNPNQSLLALKNEMFLMIQEQFTPIREELENSKIEKETLMVENEELTEYKEKVETYPEFAYLLDVAKSEIEPHEYLEGVTCKEFILQNNIPLKEDAWCTLSRRTASYYRSTKGCDPKRRGNYTVYYCQDVAYIVATLRLIMKGL